MEADQPVVDNANDKANVNANTELQKLRVQVSTLMSQTASQHTTNVNTRNMLHKLRMNVDTLTREIAKCRTESKNVEQKANGSPAARNGVLEAGTS